MFTVVSVSSVTRCSSSLGGLETSNQTACKQAKGNEISLNLVLRHKNFKKIGWQDMDWIILAQDRKR
jgi:hypothetical protein